MSNHLPRQAALNLDPDILEQTANELSLKFWGRPCQIPVLWNGRLKTSMGRFVYSKKRRAPQPLKIEMSKYAAHHVDEQTFIALLLHELCHYHLCLQNLPFHDHHPVFERELRRVGALSTQKLSLPQREYRLYCTLCGQFLGTRKRINIDKYLSSCCRQPLLKKDAISK